MSMRCGDTIRVSTIISYYATFETWPVCCSRQAKTRYCYAPQMQAARRVRPRDLSLATSQLRWIPAFHDCRDCLCEFVWDLPSAMLVRRSDYATLD